MPDWVLVNDYRSLFVPVIKSVRVIEFKVYVHVIISMNNFWRLLLLSVPQYAALVLNLGKVVPYQAHTPHLFPTYRIPVVLAREVLPTGASA